MSQTKQTQFHEVDLVEEWVGQPAKLTIDKEKGIVYGVKLVGTKSKNGLTYRTDALRDGTGLYEGMRVNLNHARGPGDRAVQDRFGRIRSISLAEDGGLKGNLFYNPHHAYAKTFEWFVEHDPEAIGMSHHARGNVRHGSAVVESLTKVFSVDLVADPATTKGLHESVGGYMDSNVNTAPPTQSPEDSLKAGFSAAIHAIVDDGSLDLAAKLAKIKEFLKMQEKALGKKDAGEGTTEEKPVQESAQAPAKDATVAELQESLRATQRELRIRDLCEAAGVKPSAALKKALAVLNDADAQSLIEEHKASHAEPRGQKPKSVPAGFMESQEPAQMVTFENRAARAAFLRGA